MRYGWKCPSCGAVMAPWVESCINCKGDKITVKAEDIVFRPMNSISCDDNITYTTHNDNIVYTAYNNTTNCQDTLQNKLNCKLNFNKQNN